MNEMERFEACHFCNRIYINNHSNHHFKLNFIQIVLEKCAVCIDNSWQFHGQQKKKQNEIQLCNNYFILFNIYQQYLMLTTTTFDYKNNSISNGIVVNAHGYSDKWFVLVGSVRMFTGLNSCRFFYSRRKVLQCELSQNRFLLIVYTPSLFFRPIIYFIRAHTFIKSIGLIYINFDWPAFALKESFSTVPNFINDRISLLRRHHFFFLLLTTINKLADIPVMLESSVFIYKFFFFQWASCLCQQDDSFAQISCVEKRDRKKNYVFLFFICLCLETTWLRIKKKPVIFIWTHWTETSKHKNALIILNACSKCISHHCFEHEFSSLLEFFFQSAFIRNISMKSSIN